MSRGLAQRAEKHFRRAIEIDPGYVEAHQELGSALLQQGRIDESAAALGNALALVPRGDDEGAVLNELARAEMQRGRLDEAGRRLEAASEIEPFSPEIHANEGILRGLRGDAAGAIASLVEALRYAPNHSAVHRHLAEALVREGPHRDPEGALVEARRAVELSPGDSGALATLQRVCAAAGGAGCAEPIPAPR
jgi:Flp pilus assembly protein TadD